MLMCLLKGTSDSDRVQKPNPVTTIHTGHHGRPHKHIDPHLLSVVNAPNRRMRRKEFATTLGVSARTVKMSEISLEGT